MEHYKGCWTVHLECATEEVKRLDAENARLRAALEDFPWQDDGNGGGTYPMGEVMRWALTTRAGALR